MEKFLFIRHTRRSLQFLGLVSEVVDSYKGVRIISKDERAITSIYLLKEKVEEAGYPFEMKDLVDAAAIEVFVEDSMERQEVLLLWNQVFKEIFKGSV